MAFCQCVGGDINLNNATKSSIVTRRIPFEFPDDIPTHWVPGNIEFSQIWNGFSLTMPHLEPFLIRTMRAALKQVNDPRVLADGAAFMSQEGQHFQTHQRLNDVLLKRYPELADVESEMKEYYRKLGTRSLTHRMAFCAGFESMTLGLTRFLIGERRSLFPDADSRITSFWLWHMVEETEHKTVAYDVYQAACGSYPARAYGVFHGSFGVLLPGLKAAILMLKKDGLWSRWGTRWRFFKQLARFVRYVGPYLLRATFPWHSPRSEEDLDWVKEWLRRYPETATLSEPPLVDTSHPDMPVPTMKFAES